MALEMNSQLGTIDISREVVATVAGGAATDCYGIVGMASQKQIKDGISELLKRDNFSRGVVIREENEDLIIDMYIIVSYGTKISEVAYNVQTKVKYQLEKLLGLNVESVNIFVQGVRVTNP
ncbi:putative alkaline-shock protein [Geomicrobium sp. JCM 19037]|uniref:Asp23/Gls24 family envelope stress response protein n=1 Tax=unclassified Geomicrobium TaxID=2628951 RepID=UPI00045F269B|nr:MULTISPECIES: Asp23/Gls24 family envelope stress response protein [unclassified Geomicrobium]GAK04666.1 putative alkaline-shock protein [Geomicrobium sp. JCM 19037]GAK10873.1 putative alkaline-shock protein [Geomicrobium sp. JCM 19039]